MLSKPTGETIQVTQNVVFDPQANHVETIYPGDTAETVIERTMYRARGYTFQVGTMTQTCEVLAVMLSGSSHFSSESYRPVGEPQFNFTQTIKWTGKQFK